MPRPPASRPAPPAPPAARPSALPVVAAAPAGPGVGPLAAFPEGATRAQMLDQRGRELAPCRRCALSRQRTQVVYGAGNPDARLMFVGEGPGAEEDAQGEPFVGRAGQLLDKIIEAMGLRRQDVYIGNIVKCRPPGNRVPQFEEVKECLPFLEEQIAIIRPEVLVALGATAATALLGRQASIGSLRGKTLDCKGTPLVCTYHPAYLLRSPGEKRKVWEDMQVVMRRLGLPVPPPRPPAAPTPE